MHSSIIDFDYNYMTYKLFDKNRMRMENSKTTYPVRKFKLSASQNFLTTIILSHYNRPKLLKQAIESVLQCDTSESRFRLLLIDDGSEIKNIDPIVEQFETYTNFEYLILEKNVGNEAVIKNMGAFLAQPSSYICFMDSDDQIISKSIFDVSINALEKNKDKVSTLSDIVYQIEMPIDELPKEQHWILNNPEIPCPDFGQPNYQYRKRNNRHFQSLLQNLTYAPDGVRVHRRSVWMECGGSLEEAVHGEAAFYLRMQKKYPEGFIHIPDDAYLYRIHNQEQITTIVEKLEEKLLPERVIVLSFMAKNQLTLDDIFLLAMKEKDHRFFEKYCFTPEEIAKAREDENNRNYIPLGSR